MKHALGLALMLSLARACAAQVLNVPQAPATAMTDCTGLVKFKPRAAYRPASLEDLSNILEFAQASKRHVKAVGSLHSWSGVQAADDIVVLPQGLAFLKAPAEVAAEGTLKVDAVARKLVRVGSGYRLRDLGPELWNLGLGLPNMGGYDAQTVGGVVNTATHGSGLARTPISDAVQSVDLVVPGGRQLRLEPADGITDPARFAARHRGISLVQDDETFRAAVAGLGTMGVAHSYVLALRERFYLDEQRTITTWDELKKQLAGDGIYKLNVSPTNPAVPGQRFPVEHVEFAINPYVTRNQRTVLVTSRKEVPAPANPGFKPGSKNVAYRIRHPEFTRPWFSESILDIDIVPNAFGRLTREVMDRFPARAPGMLNTTLKSAQDDAFIDRSYHVFVNGGAEEICAFSEEIGVPVSNYLQAVEALLAKAEEYRTRGMVQTGPISLRFVKASRATLAPYQQDTCMIDIIFLKGSKSALEMAKGYEELLVPYGGRPHFGKLNSLTPERTRLLYGAQLDAFNRVRRRLDPQGVMSNRGTDRMIGAP